MTIANLPQAPLSLAGLDTAQSDFLVALYVGAFNRAPEYAGLQFWANGLADRLNAGSSSDDAIAEIGRAMYQAGAENGEGGTDLGNFDYVNFAYENALGRAPDAAGRDFWVQALESGSVQRGDFLRAFLGGALDNQAADSDLLQARVSVAKFLAQEQVSGPGAAGLDADYLRDTINAVTGEDSARSAINTINSRFGEPEDNSQGGGNDFDDDDNDGWVPGAGSDGIVLGGGPTMTFQAGDGPDTFSLNFGDYREFTINNFDPSQDRLFLGDVMLNGRPLADQLDDGIIYVGEPRNIDEMYSSEYFTGTAGEAAFNRNTQQLVIDINGDGQYTQAEDILVNMPGVWQLEDYNFTV